MNKELKARAKLQITAFEEEPGDLVYDLLAALEAAEQDLAQMQFALESSEGRNAALQAENATLQTGLSRYRAGVEIKANVDPWGFVKTNSSTKLPYSARVRVLVMADDQEVQG